MVPAAPHGVSPTTYVSSEHSPLLAGVEQGLEECLLALPLDDEDAEPGGQLRDPLRLHHLAEDLPHQLHVRPGRQPVGVLTNTLEIASHNSSQYNIIITDDIQFFIYFGQI